MVTKVPYWFVFSCQSVLNTQSVTLVPFMIILITELFWFGCTLTAQRLVPREKTASPPNLTAGKVSSWVRNASELRSHHPCEDTQRPSSDRSLFVSHKRMEGHYDLYLICLSHLLPWCFKICVFCFIFK